MTVIVQLNIKQTISRIISRIIRCNVKVIHKLWITVISIQSPNSLNCARLRSEDFFQRVTNTHMHNGFQTQFMDFTE